MRTTYPAAFAQLRGVVLEDSVNSPAGSNMATALQGLAPTGLPLVATASPDNSCNANQSGTKALIAALPGRFHGVQVTTGNHQDVFGTDTTGLQSLVCGTPKPVNTSAVRTLSTGWLNGFASPAYLPGGSVYNTLTAAGTVTTLP